MRAMALVEGHRVLRSDVQLLVVVAKGLCCEFRAKKG
jgi:hypothetical protein